MNFRLIYQGPLNANGSLRNKHQIREALHPQLKQLWKEYPLDTEYQNYLNPLPPKGWISLIRKVGDFEFAPLICSVLKMYADIDILLLRPGPLGGIVMQGGDVDNRLKTLFDALRCPNSLQEIKGISPKDGQKPFFCLLEDDQLIYNLNVSVDRLLQQNDFPPDYVHIILSIKVKGLAVNIGNMGFIA